MITTENLSLSDPLNTILKIKDEDRLDTTENSTTTTTTKELTKTTSPEPPKRIQVPQSSSEFLTAWVDKLTANALSSLYILPFRELNSEDFNKLFNAIAHCTSLNVLTISGHDFGPECHTALTEALATNASIISLDIGSNVLGLCSEEIETLTASNSACTSVAPTTANSTSNTSTNLSDVEDSVSSTPTLRKESNLSALFNNQSHPSTLTTTPPDSSTTTHTTTTPAVAPHGGYLSHTNSDLTLVPPSPPSPNLLNPNDPASSALYQKQYSTSTPSFIHQVSSALSRNLKSYTQTQSYLSSSQGVFNQHKKNIAKNHLYHNNQNPVLPSTAEFGENDINEPDNLASFKAICNGIGMNQSIQHWNLDYKSIGPRASEILADRVLLYNTTLVRLSLARNHLGDQGCIALCQALIQSRNCTLKYLNLKDNDIGSEGMGEQGIAGLLKACFQEDPEESPVTDPEDLSSASTATAPLGITGAGPSSNSSLLGTTPTSSNPPKFLAMTPLTTPTKSKAKSVTISDTVNVETTAFPSSYLSDDGLSPTYRPSGHRHTNSNGGSHHNLLSTSYSSTISNSSICSWNTASFPSCTHCAIRELDISCNPIGDEGGVVIGEALKYNTNLRKLDMDNTDIGDETMISICRSIGSTLPVPSEDPTESSPRSSRIQPTSRLLKLSVNKNHIGVRGCEALGELLEKNPRICSLSLSANYFGDEGVQKLVGPLKISKSSTSTSASASASSNAMAPTATSPSFSASQGIPIHGQDPYYGSSLGGGQSFSSSYNSAKSPLSTGSNSVQGWSTFSPSSFSLTGMTPASTGSRRGSPTPAPSPSPAVPISTGTSTYRQSSYLPIPEAATSHHHHQRTGSWAEASSPSLHGHSGHTTSCKNTHLTSLHLSSNDITMKGFIDLVQSLPSLKLLDLHKNHIALTEKDDFSTVIKKFGLNKLQELYLSDNDMSVTDLKLICNMLNSGLTPKLEELSLTGNVKLYDDEAYEEWEERITQLEVSRPCLSITWR